MDNINENKEHALSLISRSKGEITGVDKVLSVRENCIILTTAMGELTLTGRNFNVSGFNEKDKVFRFTGDIDGMIYSKSKEPFFKKLFK